MKHDVNFRIGTYYILPGNGPRMGWMTFMGWAL